MFSKNTLTLLRIPFSFYLMPVYFFAWSQCGKVDGLKAILIFLILHLFIYPASNGYNSYQDKDESSIGGLKNPPKVTKQLFYTSLLFDVIGILLSLFISLEFFIGIIAYMLVSRAYSSRFIRLKKYPIAGFLSVIIFQGAVSFLNVYCGISGTKMSEAIHSNLIFALAASSCLIGGVYPLTQIYQHKEDERNGDNTISRMLGYKGTFLFSIVFFAAANALLFVYFTKMEKVQSFYILQGFLFPVILFFVYWMLKVFKNNAHANFENTMIMNTLASLLMNLCFIVIYFN